MDREKVIDAWSKELVRVRSQMDELGPIAVGTLSRSTKKYRTKDGKERVCADSAVLKFAGTGKNLTVRIPKDREKAVRKLLENGRKWRELSKRHLLLSSRLAVCGALNLKTAVGLGRFKHRGTETQRNVSFRLHMKTYDISSREFQFHQMGENQVRRFTIISTQFSVPLCLCV